MAVPKRKMSRSNTRSRRAQWKTTAPSLVTCVNPPAARSTCSTPFARHCGQYGAKGERRQVVES